MSALAPPRWAASMNLRALSEVAFASWPIRWSVGLVFFSRGLLRRLVGLEYRGLKDICFVARVCTVWPWQTLAQQLVLRTAARLRDGENVVLRSFLSDPDAAATADLYTLSGHGPRDILRDVIVLKAATDDEKGVILLKYARTFDAMHALFDVDRLMQRYQFVLEPCWSGYWSPTMLMYVTRQPVVVMCFTPHDLDFVERIGYPLMPIRLGPADWVNADLFQPPGTHSKKYDLVMVANWAPHKRHRQLFAALSRLEDRELRVLLIGFPWSGRTAEDIRREARVIRNPRIKIEVVEKVPAQEVAQLLSECRVFVFLSKKEGDNKALVEAMFCNVPAIVYERTVGGASSRINSHTGVLSSDTDLPATIGSMLERHEEFSPREWALANTGSAIATRRLDALLRRIATAAGSSYLTPIVEKTNSPNLAYKHAADRERFGPDYAFVMSCRRVKQTT